VINKQNNEDILYILIYMIAYYDELMHNILYTTLQIQEYNNPNILINITDILKYIDIYKTEK